MRQYIYIGKQGKEILNREYNARNAASIYHNHRHCHFTTTFHVSLDKTNMGFHASVAGTFCQNFHFHQKGEETWFRDVA